MKKVLFIHHWSGLGGSGVSLYNTWEALQNEFQVVAYIPENPKDLKDFLNSKGLEPKTYSFTCGQIPYYSGGSNIFRLGFWYLIFNAIIQLPFWAKIIKEEKPDVVLVNSKVLCWMAFLLKNKKSVCFVRETIKGSPNNFLNSMMRKMLDRFSLVSFLSEYDRNQTGCKTNTVVSPDFLRMEDYSSGLTKEEACNILKINPDTFNIVFLGGYDPIKGLDLLIHAMNELKEENVSLIVAGNTDIKKETSFFKKLKVKKLLKYKTNIQDSIVNYKLEKKIHFTGIQKDMSTLFTTADVLVFPMKDPHQARPAFEIGVQKKPVIITDFPNVREFVVDGVNGITFNNEKPREIAEAILKLMKNRDVYKNMGEKNYLYTYLYHTKYNATKDLIEQIKSDL